MYYKYISKMSTLKHSSNYAMYLITNSSLQMEKGKIGAQIGHAVSKLYQDVLSGKLSILSIKDWLDHGETKIILKATESEIVSFIKNYKPDIFIHDAGLTQVKAGSLTVIGWYPMNVNYQPEEFKRLKLL